MQADMLISVWTNKDDKDKQNNLTASDKERLLDLWGKVKLHTKRQFNMMERWG